MKFLSTCISFSLAQLRDPSQTFRFFSRFPDLAGTISELLFLSLTLLKTRGNEIVIKNRSFLDFVVPLNYIIISDFALSRFSRPRSLQTEEKWEDPSKNSGISRIGGKVASC